MKYGALILAAGASRRLGTPKQTVLLEGETLLDRSIRVAGEAGCSPVVVVLGAHEEAVRSLCRLHDVQLAFNPRWSEGMGSSLARGAAEFRDVDGIVVMTCDMPAVSPAHLQRLACSGELAASCYAGHRGTPAYFPASLLQQLRSLTGETGAKAILRAARCVSLDGGDLDIDTPEDLLRLQAPR